MNHWVCSKLSYIPRMLLYVGISLMVLLNIHENRGFQSHALTASSSDFTVPNDVMQHIALGYNHFVATWLWFETIAYYGSHAEHADHAYLAHKLHSIVRLNPKFEPVYYMACSVFPWATQKTTLSQPFAMQAMLEFPDDWRWAYYRGFNVYWFEHRNKLAAHFFELSAMKPHAPPLVTSLALRMHSDAGNIQTGLNFLSRLLKNNNDAKLQAKLLQQYKQLKTEQELQSIEKLLSKLPQRHNNASDLTALRQLGYRIPSKLADGGVIHVLKDGSLLSSREKKRFKVFVPLKRQGDKEK